MPGGACGCGRAGRSYLLSVPQSQGGKEVRVFAFLLIVFIPVLLFFFLRSSINVVGDYVYS